MSQLITEGGVHGYHTAELRRELKPDLDPNIWADLVACFKREYPQAIIKSPVMPNWNFIRAEYLVTFQSFISDTKLTFVLEKGQIRQGAIFKNARERAKHGKWIDQTQASLTFGRRRVTLKDAQKEIDGLVQKVEHVQQIAGKMVKVIDENRQLRATVENLMDQMRYHGIKPRLRVKAKTTPVE